jgi:hypothetical protein
LTNPDGGAVRTKGMRSRLLLAVALSISVFFTLAAPTRHRAINPPKEEQPPVPASIDARRSMVITDVALLQNFTFQRFLDALIARSGVQGLTATELYRQMLDTQNPKPGLADPLGPHCNDFLDGAQPTFNGFPRRCPTPEGPLAQSGFSADEYIPIALTNRFDQAPADGSNCGQYRIVFARRMAQPRTRLHIILEPVLRNPNPSAGIAGCRPVALFWANLTTIDDLSVRRAKLEQFYFDGIAGFPPVIDPDNFSAASGGGIRTTQVAVAGAAPRNYQFRVTKDCSSGACTLRMTPDVLNDMPYGELFDAGNNSDQAKAFRDVFVAQVPNLAVKNANEYFMDIPRQFLMAESNPADDANEFDYATPFNRSKVGASDFKSRIQQKLTSIGSTLTPEQIVFRAQTQSCLGCHALFGNVGEGVVFPRPIDDVQHITEDTPEPGDGGQRYRISSALQDTFVPHRIQILLDFLNSGKAPVRSQ